VPTNAMADILIAEFAVPRSKVEHIPWGVPDALIDQSVVKLERGGPLRLLYAGRLSSEKLNGHLLEQIVRQPDLQLCVAAPRSEWDALAASSDVDGVHYLGWLNRRGLWAAFQDMDLLLMPSSELEAFGLVAIEAQASGLPVAYQRVPGLEEVMGSSGIAVDFSSPVEVYSFLSRIVQSPSILAEQVILGRRNSERFRLSDTATNLLDLSKGLSR
jgi:glycosyltransferase involved in cell wall biosynthesis